MELLLATRNQHKTREFHDLLGTQCDLIDLGGFPQIEMPNETGETFADNAVLKAVMISKDRELRDWFVIADDSGIEVSALGGAPGVYSTRFAGENASDAENVNKLLRELKDVQERSARFRCVIALARGGKILGTFEGAVEGEIVNLPRGRNGFGYDPIFQPTGFEETFAEMAAELKNKISHRGQAIATMREALREIRN
jgi:XTP/dITP diphosphohydrolase